MIRSDSDPASAAPKGTERVFGLDVLRATAIAFVVLTHSSPLLYTVDGPSNTFSSIDGVDLFFVLSGFLVGRLLLKTASGPALPWRKRLLDFWQRRWLRTLPGYFVFLVINILLVRSALAPGMLSPATLAYAVFLQNFHKPLDLFFWESWSLAVEEWFYLALPLLLFAFVRFGRIAPARAYLFSALLLCVCPLLVRLWMVPSLSGAEDLDLYLGKLVITRVDSIGIGAVAAWMCIGFPRSWERFRWPLFLVGVAAVLWMSAMRVPAGSGVVRSLYFTANPLCIGMLLPVLSHWRTMGRIGWPVVQVSKLAYALYLVHMPVRHLYQHAEFTSGVPVLVRATAYWAFCLLAALFFFHAVESPFMRMRERIGSRIRGG